MSSPSGKPFGSPDRPASSHRDSERRRDDGEQTRSPYAPKRVRGGFIAEPVRRTEEAARRADDDAAVAPKFLLSSRDENSSRDAQNSSRDAQNGPTDFPKDSLKFEDELNAAGIGRPSEVQRRRPPREPAQPPAPPTRQPDAHHGSEPHGREQAAPPSAQMIDDDELKRLEESVRLLQREVSANRGRTSDAPLPTSAVTAEDAGAHRRRGDDAYIDGFRVPRSLQPEILRRPPEEVTSRGKLQTALAIVIAGVVAAPIAYYFSSGSSDPGSETVLAAAETSAIDATPIPVRTQRVDPAAPRNRASWQSVPTHVPMNVPASAPAAQASVPAAPAAPVAAPPQPASPPPAAAAAPAPAPQQPAAPATTVPRRASGETAERSRASAEQAQPAAPSAPKRQLGQAEVDLLVKQGQQFVTSGDFVTARLVFQRAAEAGNAVAALALGATYDPGILKSLGVRGVEADVSKARAWYQKAKEFGDPEATRRLDVLANRGGG